MIKKLGLANCRLYDTRHTHLTQLLSSGINAKAVAARAGHANATVLLTTYAHVLPETAVDAANIIERRMAQSPC
jgi:integrase